MEAALVLSKIGSWFNIISICSSADPSDVDLVFSSTLSTLVGLDLAGEAVGSEDVALVSGKIGSWLNTI